MIIHSVSAKRFGDYYKTNGKTLQYHYKNHLSDIKIGHKKEHAEDWLLYGKNLGKYLSLDETSLSKGELYSILTNKEANGKKGIILAIVKDTKDQWTQKQQQRTKILFEYYPDIKKAYMICQQLRTLFNNKTISKGVAYTKLAKWFKEVEDSGFKDFNIVANSISVNYKSILNYFDNLSTNASAESFNAKIKAFRAQFRGVRNVDFFLYRLTLIFS